MARGLGHVYRRGKIWWIKYSVDGVPRYESSESENKTDATNLLKKRLGRPKKVLKTGRQSVKDLLDNLLLHYKKKNPRSYDSYAVPVTKHLIDGLGPIKAAKLNKSFLQEYVDTRLEEEASPASINRELSVLRRAFNLAKDDLDLDAVPKFSDFFLNEAAPRKGFLEPAGYHRVFTELPDDLKPALVIGYHTGLRKAKVLGLRIEQFDLTARKIYMDPTAGETTKTAAKALPIYGEMEEFCRQHIARTQKELPSCHWFCHRKDGSPIIDIRPAWENATEAAGFPGLLFHDLRRSAVRNMVRAGIPERVAMSISGHKTRAIFERYNIVSEKDLDEAGDKLEQYLGAKQNGDKTVTEAKAEMAKSL